MIAEATENDAKLVRIDSVFEEDRFHKLANEYYKKPGYCNDTDYPGQITVK